MKVVKVIQHLRDLGKGQVTDVRLEDLPIMLEPHQVWVDPRGHRWQLPADRPHWTNCVSIIARLRAMSATWGTCLKEGDVLTLEGKP